ncbi:Nose resistant to fluoxetine protein 6 like protein [Argiope bruennichi]|uniref:Nose resistant to fluoxetine protein 6 like protein n=1 Tax=Argiope bruennichi TaxID=94029 RepID=A0A8T0EVF6_ARGBR|nr:Nose resistant to fluoxetine protein 6 like protein [Argiope bruennichi]
MKFIYNIVAIILLCVALEGKCQGSLIGDMVQNTENMTVLEKWQNMEKNLKKATSEVIKMALPHIMKASENLNISSQCLLETMKLVMGLKNLKPWAFKFIDSSAKMVDGLLVGSVSSLGVYDECLNTEVKSEKGKNKEDVIFRGKYCTIDIKPSLPPKAKFYWMHETIPELRNLTLSGTVMGEMAKYAAFFYFISLKMSICVPSGCMVEDIDQVAQMLGNYLMLEVKTSRCEVKEDLHFTKTNICVMFLYCFFGFLVLIGSLIDMYSYYTGIVFKRTSVKFFLSFSFISNFKKFVNTETTSNNNLNCLHGIRFLSMSWIILGHTYFLLNIQATQNLESGRHYGGMLAFQAILNGTVGVDTFFCIGGLLLCYFTIKIVKIEGLLKFLMYIFQNLGMGQRGKYLWSVLLPIASPLFPGFLKPYVKICSYSFFETPTTERTIFWKKGLYFFFLLRSHIFGLSCLENFCYLLVTRPNFKMSATVQIIGWIAAFICCFSTVYGPVNWNGGKEINFFAGLMYASFHRIAWALGVAWLIVCCATGRGGVINYILSWKIFIPLGRLTFIAYLIHPLVQVAFMGNLRHIFVPSHLFIVWIFIADLWVSYAIAFAACMLVEAPMMSLEKIILRKGDKKTEDPSLARSNSILKGTLKPEKNGDIAFIVVSDSDKSLGKDNETFSKL